MKKTNFSYQSNRKTFFLFLNHEICAWNQHGCRRYYSYVLCHRKNIFNILVGDIIVYAEEGGSILITGRILTKKKQSKAKPKITEATIFPSLQSATTGGIGRIDHLIKKTHHRYLPGIMTTTTTTTCRSNNARFITNALIFLTVICGGSIVTHHPGSMRLHVVSAYVYTIIPGSRILTTKTTTTTTRTFLTQQPGQWKNQNKNHVIDITRNRNNNSYKQHRLQRQQQRPTTTTTTTTSSSSSSSTRLYHMGHSHSHHDHGHSSSSSTNNNNKSKTYNKQERMVRRLAIVLVCWIATCGTKLFQAAKLTQNDWISFVVTSVALTSADNIKKAFERSVDNLSLIHI